MLALDSSASSLALGIIVLGLALCAIPLLDRTETRSRTIVLLIITALAWRYIAWRFGSTLPKFELAIGPIVAWAFAALEGLTVLSSTSAAFILTRTKSRSKEAEAHASWWAPGAPPRVDIYIATYNEELAVLERTIVGAKNIDYPALRIFILDDGRRGALEEACRSLGVEYRTRPDNDHAKAGNINHTLRQRLTDSDPPDFVAVLDADFVPHSDFIRRALALFHDKEVGLVQTPQHFFNPDPIQHNLGISAGYPDEQRFFFDHVEPARDAWSIAVCCGTSSMARTRALATIGGFPTESVTEDFLLTLRLDENGWRTVYLNEPLTEGLAPEGLQEYIVQRGRWCLGMMQIVRNVYPPFGSHRLRLIQRFSVMDSLLYWSSTFSFRLASLVCPLLYWYFGITVVNASVAEVLFYYVPYYVAVLAGLNWLSRGMIIPLLNDVSQLVAAWPIVRAVAMGLLTRGPHKFRVTAKGGDRQRTIVQWPLMRPFIVIFLLTVGGLLSGLLFPERFGYGQIAGDGLQIVLFWTIYNIGLLIVAMMACIERPREDRPQRVMIEGAHLIVDDLRIAAWVTEVGPERARLRGPAGLTVGQPVKLELSGVGTIAATISVETADGYQVRLTPTDEQRSRLIRKLHTAIGAPGTVTGSYTQIVKQLARKLSQ